MQRIERIIIVVLFVALLWVWKANAGDPAGPGTAPDSTNWYTIDAIYERLNAGTDGSQSTFSDPSVDPGTSTMKTLNDVMGIAPAKNDTNGATTAHVVSGKKFWGLTSGQWGLQDGTANEGSNVMGEDGKLSMAIPDGFYSGSKSATAQDTDLTAGNIKKDVDIFGVTGTLEGGSTYEASVPKTGQTKCYNASNSEVPCPATDRIGQDGQFQKGVALPSPRFTNNNNGTVTDNLTGLIWLKNANCAETIRNWETALSDVTQLNTDGKMNGKDCADTSNSGSHQTDWRLPNVRELHSLIHYGYHSPALSNTAGDGQWTEGKPFTNVKYSNVQSDYYWSSTTYSDDPLSGWIVFLNDGYVDGYVKTNLYYVWPVRGGQ